LLRLAAPGGGTDRHLAGFVLSAHQAKHGAPKAMTATARKLGGVDLYADDPRHRVYRERPQKVRKIVFKTKSNSLNPPKQKNWDMI